MKKNIKKYIATLLIFSTLLAMSGCGSTGSHAYVKGILDANYHGELDDYLHNTTADRSEAKALLDGNAKLLAENLISYYDLDINIESDAGERFMNAAKGIYKKTKYEVSKAYKEGDLTFVDVTVYPLDLLEPCDGAISEYIENMNKKIADGYYNDYVKDDYKNEFANGILDIIANEVSQPTYADPVTIKVEVTKTEESMSMTIEDLLKIEKALIKVD